jgi:hypothetical protein
MNKKIRCALVLSSMMLVLVVTSRRLQADSGTCVGVTTALPFTDIAGNAFFCQIAEAFFSGLANGTSPTKYSPSDNVPREQMAAFITRMQNSALRRGSRRAALDQWATPNGVPLTARTAVGSLPGLVASDGIDLWVADFGSEDVRRVRASDGSLLGTWSGAAAAAGVLVTRGRIYVTGSTNPGRLFVIDPSKPPQAVNTLSTSLGEEPLAIAADGFAVWTANNSSVSRFDPESGSLSNITTGFSRPRGIVFDGAYIWVTDFGDNMLKRLDSRNGDILQGVPVGTGPQLPVFDGSNIWVPNFYSNSLTVVRARDGLVLATLTANGLNLPLQAAFDGQRILVTNDTSISLWKANDLTPIGSFFSGPQTNPTGACSDGINFWITLENTNKLGRF